MPQFDIYTFLTQAFYIFISSGIFFYFVSLLLARLSEVLKFREKFFNKFKDSNVNSINLYSLTLMPLFEKKSKQISKFLSEKLKKKSKK